MGTILCPSDGMVDIMASETMAFGREGSNPFSDTYF